ncbi:hypothetical protein VTP01DRAFT_1297 [Rhizomucor pusillus]|uniref:uncharacterized protein n=1 Tax=Rhizomucor pusillus TaxID=4840 RepID=UPI0037439608
MLYSLKHPVDMTSVLTRHLQHQPFRASPSSSLPLLQLRCITSSPLSCFYFNKPPPRVKSARSGPCEFRKYPFEA